MRIVLDVENDFSIIKRDGKPSKNDVMPFSGNNSLVSVGIKNIDTGETTYHFFSHSELTHSTEEAARKREEIQQLLLNATLIIGHFLKHDIIWMLCSGFKVPRVKFWDTGIAEYVMHRGQKRPLDLKSLAEKHDLTRKKSDLVSEYFANGTTTSLIPIDILEEYGRGDLDTTGELYLNQCKRLEEQENAGLLPTIHMMNDFMYVLARWQMNGIKIDKVELERVKAEYQQEQTLLTARLNEIARKYMGDTPFSITSPEDMSVLIYSRRLLNKKDWKEAFNIGTDERGKSLRRPRMKPAEFASKIRELTVIEYRTKAAQCETCGGTGKVSRELKKGGLSAPRYNCQTCNRVGIIYTPQNRIAGFKFQPEGVKSTSANGFVTDADTIERLAKTATGEPKEFLEKLVRLHAVNVYISTFCDGILNNLTKNNFLHTNFNQTVTATARLSSTDPNFQNQPRGNTFPVRRAVISRFKGGNIVDGDFAQLEFRVAGALSGDKQVLHDVTHGVDVHAFTRDTLNAAGMEIDRQGAKSHSFKPLYGGEYGTPAEMTYYQAFKRKYKGVAKWQQEAGEIVLRRKVFTLPTGRQYCWPRAERKWNGKVDFFTQIVNYPVQGFATADIVPLACILLDIEFEKRGLQSIPFLTVHDSISIDTHPEEVHIIPSLVAECMLAVKEELKVRYDYDLTVPLEVEVKEGVNWLDTKVVVKKGHEFTVDKPKNDFIDDSLEGVF